MLEEVYFMYINIVTSNTVILLDTLDRFYRCDKASPSCCRVDWCEGSDRVVERSWKCIINADCRGTP